MITEKDETPKDANLNIRVNKKWKEKLDETADSQRYSTSEYVIEAVDEKMANERR